MKLILENWKRYLKEQEETALAVVNDAEFYKKAGRALVLQYVFSSYSRPVKEGLPYFMGKAAITSIVRHAIEILNAGSIEYDDATVLPIDENHVVMLQEIINYTSQIEGLLDTDPERKIPVLLPQHGHKFHPAIMKVDYYSDPTQPNNTLAQRMMNLAFINLFGMPGKKFKKEYDPAFEKSQYQELFRRVDQSVEEINVSELGFKINPTNITIESLT
jgi:hypothetical protein